MIITLLIIGILVLVLSLIIILTKPDINLEKEIIINKPIDQVFDYIKYAKNHDDFNAWLKMDPDMKKEYRGTDGQEGFIYAWHSDKSKNAGTGEQETKKIIPNSYLEFELRFKKPFEDVASAKMFTTSISPNQTMVKWGFYSKIKSPLMKLMKPIMISMLGKSLQEGLNNLKNVLDNK